MRSLTNLIVLALIFGGIYYAVKSPAAQEIYRNYMAQTKSDLGNLSNGSPVSFNLKDITNSLSNLMSPSMMGGDTTMPTIVTPGPLVKIPTQNGTTETQATTSGALSGSAGFTQGSVQSATPSAGTALDAKGVIIATNVQRGENNAAVLSESAQLDASALVKARDILARQYFEHMAPDGRTVSDLVADQGYTYIKIGENLALGDFTSDADVVTAWMNSPGHRANILDPQFQQIGVGIAYGMYQGHMVYVAVQHFGKPTSACPSINEALKAEVTSGQAELTAESNALQAQKMAIDQGTANNTDETTQISSYNSGVEKYQADYAKVDAERVQYNAQVTAYNACINAVN